MASLIAKKKGNQLYYYVVESARIEGKPRIVHQAYLGTADKVAALVKDRTSPVPLSAASRDFGLPGALWLAAEQTGLFGVLETLWPASRSGPFASPLPVAGRHPPHLPTRAQNRSGRLVRQNHSAFSLGHSARTFHLPSLLGCLGKDSAGAPGSAGQRRRRSPGPAPNCVCWICGKESRW